MAIKIEFDGNLNPQHPTFVLATRSGKKLGVLSTIEDVTVKDSSEDSSEISFDLYKFFDGKEYPLWNDVTDFKLLWCKEWDKWFSIQVKITESNNIVKNIIATNLGDFELEQTNLYDVEINTEDDIKRDDYTDPTIFYNPDKPECSLLHRILSKAPHYSIAHVDNSLWSFQRSFSFDNKSIKDAFKEVSEEIGCVFMYDSGSDQNGKILRSISVYDTMQTCVRCGFRGDYSDVCPECGSTNIQYGHGDDTTIFVSTDCLTEEITFETDIGSVKNCYKLSAGDDYMTSVVRSCDVTPGGYMWYMSDEMRREMSQDLAAKLTTYDNRYKYHNEETTIDNQNLVSAYNTLVAKYKSYNKDLEALPSPLKGFPNLIRAYYEAIDFGAFLKTSLMPSPQIDHRTAADQIALLTAANLSPVALTSLTKDTKAATVESAISAMAGVVADSALFRITIKTTSWSKPTWVGTITLTSYSDSDDTATTGSLTLTINDNFDKYTEQLVKKRLKALDSNKYGIVSIFEQNLSTFKNTIKAYGLDSLDQMSKCCQDVLNIIVKQGGDVSTSSLYNLLYVPYTQKKSALETEMNTRSGEIGSLNSLKQSIETVRDAVWQEMDYENYLGNELWIEFCSFRLEDEYSNSNYISDDLSNKEVVDKALEFLKRAKEEIYKAARMQHTISATLNNLLVIPEFSPLVDFFCVGNWIRVRVDEKVYRLRLTEYEVNYSDLSTINVTFTDVTQSGSTISNISKVLSKAVDAASSVAPLTKLASDGAEAAGMVNNWVNNGLTIGDQLNLVNSDGVNIFGPGGELVVSLGVDQTDLANLIQDIGPSDAEDAVVLRIDSSRGLVFKNDMFSTELRVTILYGTDEITTIAGLHSYFGDDSYLEWSWRKYEDDDWSLISVDDPRLSNNGFLLTVSPADVNEQIVFQCDLITS